VVLFTLFLVISICATLFAPAQKVFTMLFFSLTGIAFFLLMFLLWLFNRKD
jgi:hypothetical protein